MFMLWFLYGLAVYYVTQILLFEKKDSHHGPFPHATKRVRHAYVIDGNPALYEYPVTLFDWVRRLFGLYNVHGEVWLTNHKRLEMWTCPICLSFWVAIFGAPLFMFEVGLGLTVIYILSAAGLSSFLHSLEVFNASRSDT